MSAWQRTRGRHKWLVRFVLLLTITMTGFGAGMGRAAAQDPETPDVDELLPLMIYSYGVWVDDESDNAKIKGTITINVINNSDVDFKDVSVTATLCKPKLVDSEAKDASPKLVKPGHYVLYSCEFTAPKSKLNGNEELKNTTTAKADSPLEEASMTEEILVGTPLLIGSEARFLGSYRVGDTIAFSIHFYSEQSAEPGGGPLTDITVAGSACDAAAVPGDGGFGVDYFPRSGGWYVCQHLVTEADLKAGSVVNAWSLAAKDHNGEPVSLSDFQDAAVEGAPAASPSGSSTTGSGASTGYTPWWLWALAAVLPATAVAWGVFALTRRK